MNFVIIWQDVPERLRVFEYATNDNSFIERIERCHRNLLGCADEHIETDIMWLGELLCGTYTPSETPLFAPLYDSGSADNDPRYINNGGKLIVTGYIM